MTTANFFSLEYAKSLDQKDELSPFRNKFIFPKHKENNVLYFTGNSLGLQPKSARDFILQELDDWGKFGVEGHFKAKRNWFGYHHFLTKKLAKLVGAKDIEVVAMNTLTVNLNLLMLSFYNPIGKRTKIMMEGAAFPSDHYAVQQLIKFYNLDPSTEIIYLEPQAGEVLLKTEEILKEIEKNKNTLALIMLGGVNYYTGQFFEIEKITKAAQAVGAYAGFDLAHAVGNLPLKLHDWGVDFATWCSYKYLNSGPGGVSGIFVHERHATSKDIKRLGGWWGHDESKRFMMEREYKPIAGAQGWQMSNAQILPMAAHLASLEIFDEVGMEKLRIKSINLTGYLEQLLETISELKIITPKDPAQRGCQLSIISTKEAKKLFEYLKNNGIVADWREPDVIRVAPVPLYNSFEDVYRLAEYIKNFYAN